MGLVKYSDFYLRCERCNTLINSPRFEDSYFDVNDEENSYYGKNYWLEHQTDDLGLRSIYDRVRSDLSERCLYWLKIVLKYLSSNDRTLEVGFGSGGLIALLSSLGYRSEGVELSGWLVDYVKNIYDVNVLQGSIEKMDRNGGGYDSVFLFDVMEHLPQPLRTLKHINEILTDNGYLFIQTPHFQNYQMSENELRAINDPFLEMMIDSEHLYLYTENGLRELLQKSGFNFFYLEKALFPYDTFLVASKTPIVRKSDTEVESFLASSRNGRIAQALIDVYDQRMSMENEAILRLGSIERLEAWLKESEADRADRLIKIDQLQTRLEQSEKDSTERLQQVTLMGEMLRRTEKDCMDRLEQMNIIGENLRKTEENRMQDLERITVLETQLNQSLLEIDQLREHLQQVIMEKDSFQKKLHNFEQALAKRKGWRLF